MEKLIIDCDNTFGIEGCDIDDGLAIIYALASNKYDIIGITTTFGNSTIDTVYPNTLKFMKQIGRPEIPVLKGTSSNAFDNQAAKFLAEVAEQYKGQISVLATGSLTNLYHAYRIDGAFYENLKELSLMGGITEPLIINGKVLNELNFSCDYEASFNVLTYGKNIKIATGNNCLAALFTKASFDKLNSEGNAFLSWLYKEGQYWFKREKEVFKNEGIYKWDVYAAAVLINPDLFHDRLVAIAPDRDSLKTGFLLGEGEKRIVNLPEIKDPAVYIQHVYEAYKAFSFIE